MSRVSAATTTEELVASRPDGRGAGADAAAASIVVLDDVRSAHNVGLVFRLCDCVNVEALWLTGITAWPGRQRARHEPDPQDRGGGEPRGPALGAARGPRPRREAPEGGRVARRRLEQGEGAMPWREVDVRRRRSCWSSATSATAFATASWTWPTRSRSSPSAASRTSLNVALCASAVLYEVLARWEAEGA